MAEKTKASRGCEPCEAQVVTSLAGERRSLTLPASHAQASTDRRLALAHHEAALETYGAHQAGELALAAFYQRRADALDWRVAA